MRNRLTIFRAKYFNKELPKVELKARRRLGEIMKPLYQILMLIDGDRKEEFEDYVSLEEVKKREEEGIS